MGAFYKTAQHMDIIDKYLKEASFTQGYGDKSLAGDDDFLIILYKPFRF